MNGLYQMLLFLFALGAASQGINSLGVLDMTIPDQGLTVGEAVVTDTQSGAVSSSGNSLNSLDIVFTFMTAIGAGVVAMFTIVPMVLSWGTAMGAEPVTMLALAMMLQAPITLVTLFGLYELWTGKSVI